MAATDVCDVCGGDLFMVASGDVTCLKRCKFVAPDKLQSLRLRHTRIENIPNQLREFGKATDEQWQKVGELVLIEIYDCGFEPFDGLFTDEELDEMFGWNDDEWGPQDDDEED